jgi:hypothetical protein
VTCQPTFYSKKFKAACPGAYSYAYDDPSSIFTCAQSPDYTIIFCSNRYYHLGCSYTVIWPYLLVFVQSITTK